MNYLAHAYRFLDQPCFLAGTALPDWMNVIDRKNRARERFAVEWIEAEDPCLSQFARGVVQHHRDDDWFHRQEEFMRLSTNFAVSLRNLLPPNSGHQCGFLGHISVELLLDAFLIERDRTLLLRYYAALKTLDPEKIQQLAGHVCRKPVTRLTTLLPRFISERFLDDYVEDERLLYRLNGVMFRVGLPDLPFDLVPWLATARRQVYQASSLLLPLEGNAS